MLSTEVERDAFEAVGGWARDALRMATEATSAREATRKGEPFDLVTEMDGQIERYLRDQVRSRFPDHEFLGEEQGGTQSPHPWRWIVDPIDGTLNYSAGAPGSTCSIALAKDGELIVGAIADYSAGLVYRSIGGSGTILVRDGATESVARPSSSPGGAARLFLEFGWEDLDEVTVGVIGELAELRLRVIRMIGGAAAAILSVALHGGCMFGLGLRTWDIAAGIVIAREAGREVRTWEQGPVVHVVVGTAADVTELAPIIERYGARRVPRPVTDAR